MHVTVGVQIHEDALKHLAQHGAVMSRALGLGTLLSMAALRNAVAATVFSPPSQISPFLPSSFPFKNLFISESKEEGEREKKNQ